MTGVRRRALVDLEALEENLRGELAADPEFRFDARADAYGHLLAVVLPVARAVGVDRVRVTSETDADLARTIGFPDLLVGRTDDPIDARGYGVDRGRPALAVSGEVVAVKRVAAGEGVSYGYSWRPEVDSTLALVALGYADGIPRPASNLAPVLLAGETRRIVGRIAMDQFVVDCADAQPAPGDRAVLFGDPARGEPALTQWARVTGRHPLLLTAALGPRIVREVAS